jgi:hypothetical protein
MHACMRSLEPALHEVLCCLLSKSFASVPCLHVCILAKHARHPRSSEQASQPKFLVVGHPSACPTCSLDWQSVMLLKNPNAPSCPKDCCKTTCRNTRCAPKAMLTGAETSCQQWQRGLPPGKLLPQRLLQQPQCQVRHGSAPNLKSESARTATNCCMQMCSEPT